MAQVITLENYTPIARYDETPWTHARIEEAADPDEGPWVALETIALDPVDADPSQPQARNLTTELADDAYDLWYRIVFVDASTDESIPTTPVQNGAPPNLYVTADELKALIGLQNESFGDDAIDLAVETASRAIDAYKRKDGVGFYPTTQVRYYSPGRYDDQCPIDDLAVLTSLEVDGDGDGDWETEWTEGVEFVLGPQNAAANGRPFNRITLNPVNGSRFPGYLRGVKITGQFGWASTPVQVRQAAVFLANHLLHTTRDLPHGVLIAAAAEAIAMSRAGGIHPTAKALLDTVDPAPAFGSLRLG